MNQDELDPTLFRKLSKEATEEILGDELVFLVAIGKKGKVIQFFPEGKDIPKVEYKLCNEKLTESLSESTGPALKLNISIPNMDQYSDSTCQPKHFTTNTYAFSYWCGGFPWCW